MSMQFQCQIRNSAKLEKETRAPKAPKVHYWRTGQWNIIISHGVSVRHSSPPTFIHSFGDLCRSSSRSSRVCMYIQGYRRGATRTRLTNCLCLSPAIFSPGYCFAECDRPTDRTNERAADGRTDGVNEPRQRASISSQPVTLPGRVPMAYILPVPCSARYPVPFVCPDALAIPRGIPCRTHKIHRLRVWLESWTNFRRRQHAFVVLVSLSINNKSGAKI